MPAEVPPTRGQLVPRAWWPIFQKSKKSEIRRYDDKAATWFWLKWVGQNHFLVITLLSCNRICWKSYDWYSFFAADLTVCLTALGDQLESEIWTSETAPSTGFYRNQSKKSKLPKCWKFMKIDFTCIKIDFRCIKMHVKYTQMHVNA